MAKLGSILNSVHVTQFLTAQPSRVLRGLCAPRQGGTKVVVSIANFSHFFMTTIFITVQ